MAAFQPLVTLVIDRCQFKENRATQKCDRQKIEEMTCPPRLPHSQGESASLVFIVFGFGLGKRVGRGALKLLKRPARFCWCLVPER